MNVVQKTCGDRSNCFQATKVNPRMGSKRVPYEAGQVDGAQVAGAIRWQRDFPAGAGGGQTLAVPKIVGTVDPVDEQDAGFNTRVFSRQQFVPQGAGRNAPVHQARLWRHGTGPYPLTDFLAQGDRSFSQWENQRPRAVGLDGAHEFVSQQRQEIEVRQRFAGYFCLYKGFDIGVVAAQCRHHGATTRIVRLHLHARRLPHLHE